MRYENVVISGLGTLLPEEVVPSEALEARLSPVYERLNLNPGRLELMSGIRTRRFFEPGTRPSAVAARAGRAALDESGIDPQRIGCLIHASVCRDFMEPATATVVHAALGLGDHALAFDLSNACLGVANAMVLIAGMIERGEIEAGLVVAGEDGRPLVDTTIETLLARESEGHEAGPVTRDELKRAFASLTIGSGAAAVVLTSRSLAERSGAPVHRLLGGAGLADTSANDLCRGGHAAGATGPLMETDSEALLHAGNALARRTWDVFCAELEWTRADVERVVTHQVGIAHRRLTFESLGLDLARDFPTVETLGNIGSVSLPLTLKMAAEAGFIEPGQRVAMLGIGSGLQCLMLGLSW